jgi:long-chain acyl-CoA synthetase
VRNLTQQLEATAEATPDKAALLLDERSLTFRELDDWARVLAGGLGDLGVGVGDRVAVMSGSNAEFLAALYGIWKLGAIAVAINGQLGASEVRYQLVNSGAVVALSGSDEMHGVLGAAAEGLASVRTVVEIGKVRGEPRAAVDVPITADATIFYTSGTTGTPKGATHTHRALAVLVEQGRAHYGISDSEIVLSVLPIYLLSILVLGPVASIAAGATCRLMPRYEPAAFARHVRQDGTTYMGATIPMMFADLLKLPPDEAELVDLSTIRAASCGGSPMPPEIRRAFEDRYDFRFVHAYGGTEGPAVVSTDPFDRDRKFDSVGMPLAHIRVTIEDTEGNELPPGEVGEICTSAHADGPYAGVYEPIRCYWDMPEATAEALRGGKLHWGDLGYLDEDGFLYLVERKKDMIIRGGMNVYPKELEALLYEDPRIAECAVVARSHERYGEVPYAFVRLAEGRAMTEDEVVALVNERSAKFKHLAGATIVEEFPRNALGKILKRELRDLLASGAAGG